MNGLHEPELDGVVLVLKVELAHLVGCSLRQHVVLLDVLPKSNSVKVFCFVLTHDLEQFDALRDRELLLPTDVQPLAVFVVALHQKMVVFVLQHLVPMEIIEVPVGFLDGFLDPRVLVNAADVEIAHFELGFLGLDLVSAGLVLINDHAAIFLDELFGLVEDVSALGNKEH